MAVGGNQKDLACQGAANCFGFMRDDGEKDTRSAFWLAALLFPILHGANIKTKAQRKFGLG
jgi:hypothetical protein